MQRIKLWPFVLCFPFLCAIAVEAQSPVSSADLSVLPTEGKAAGIVRTTVDGRWLVFGNNFTPVQHDAYKLSSGGSVVMWEGEPGGVYGVIFIPDDPTQGIAARQVKLGLSPKPPPPDPPNPPAPKDIIRAILIYESEEMTAELGSLFQQIRNQNLPMLILDKDMVNENGQPFPGLSAVHGKPLPIIAGFNGEAELIATEEVPKTTREVEQIIVERWGLK